MSRSRKDAPGKPGGGKAPPPLAAGDDAASTGVAARRTESPAGHRNGGDSRAGGAAAAPASRTETATARRPDVPDPAGAPDVAAFLAGDHRDPAPDLSLVRLIHRADDGFASFHRSQRGEFTNLFSIPNTYITLLPKHVPPHLRREAFFSVNSFYRGGYTDSPVFAAFDSAYRECDGLKWLNACFADLDCYRLNLDPHDVVREVLRMEQDGLLPPVSIVAMSGRGVWVYWLLRDPADPSLPQRAWPEAIDQYRAVQDAIARLLGRFGAEANDPARVTRVPGSVHAGTGRRVKYLVRATGEGGAPPTHALRDLTAIFQATPARPGRRARGKRPAKPNPKKRAGLIAMLDIRLRRFKALRATRGGFRKGTREWAAFIYAGILALKGYEGDRLRDAVYALGDDCIPPLPHSECDKAVASARKHNYPMKNQTISDRLGVTPEESREIGGWPPASRYGGELPDEPAAKRDEKTVARRKLIRHLTDAAGRQTIRRMVERLSERGHRASRGTVASDYEALSI